MYAIRLELAPPSVDEPSAGAGPVRDALLRLPLDGARMCHARVVSAHGGLAAVCFLAAVSLLAAERSLRAAAALLTGPEGPLPGWELVRCEADPWIALGLHEASTRS
ncbi:hypothetical protein AB0K51_16475 [Kitasatospora sp. NPDC049285]|uniref:hypothetical protein n=1 Tax=Kitasatospora sp. NPDC049285 TaxID=3157096 RepID=UPI00342DD685